MRSRLMVWSALLVCSSAACDDASSSSGAMADLGIEAPDARPLPDTQVLDAQADASPDARATDAQATDAQVTDAQATDSGPQDAGPPDALPPDAALAMDCASACAQLTDCEVWPEGACEALCGRAAPDRAEWLSCVNALDGCEGADACLLPPPSPLTCEATCAAFSACGLDALLDCEAACEASPRWAECGAGLYLDRCDPAPLLECAAMDFRHCADECAVVAECAGEGAVDLCIAGCIDGAISADPLKMELTARRGRCLAQADQCLAVLDCLDPPPFGARPAGTCDPYCDLWGACFGPEDEVLCNGFCADRLNSEGRAYQVFVDCGLHYLGGGRCQEAAWQACARGDPGLNGGLGRCVERCEVQQLCGRLEVDPANPLPEQALTRCTDECAVQLQGVFPAYRDLTQLLNHCADAPDCGAFSTCLDAQTPEMACPFLCARMAACPGAEPPGGVPEGVACEAHCEAQFERARFTAWRLCMAEAQGCEARQACNQRPSAPCDAFCDRAEACEIPGFGAHCPGDCDNRHLLNPDFMEAHVACVLGAEACQGEGITVSRCLNFLLDATPPLMSCTRYCDAAWRCGEAPDAAGYQRCLEGCVPGLPTEQALGLAAASPCLTALPEGSSCEALAACLPQEAPPVDCLGVCLTLQGCGVGRPACEAECQQPAGRALAACVLEAQRLQGGCERIRACAQP